MQDSFGKDSALVADQGHEDGVGRHLLSGDRCPLDKHQVAWKTSANSGASLVVVGFLVLMLSIPLTIDLRQVYSKLIILQQKLNVSMFVVNNDLNYLKRPASLPV